MSGFAFPSVGPLDLGYRVYPWISLLAWWLTFSQVGLSRYCEITHWVTILDFILHLAEIPTISAFLAQCDHFQKYPMIKI
jgi:hypothetical protein